MSKFKVGDKVTWSSQSAGSGPVKKVGEIVEVVPPRSDPNNDVGAGTTREAESYVVHASAVTRTGKPRPARLYWPLASKLERAS